MKLNITYQQKLALLPGQKHNLVWDGIKYLGLSKHDDEINVEESLESQVISRSPLGAKVTAHKEGEWDSNPQTNQLQFDISIVPTTENYYQFPSGASLSVDTYNIKEIVIMRVADPSEFSLSTEEIARVEAKPGQTEFTIDTFGEFETVDPKVHYYAFALTQAGLKIEDASGSSEDVEYVLLGKVTLEKSIELTSVEYVFYSQTYDNVSSTCDPYNILSNLPAYMNDEEIDRSKIRHITYTASTGISGGSTNSNNSLSIESSSETTEFKLDVMEELVTMVQPQAIGTGFSFNTVKYGFTVLNGPLNCQLSGTVNDAIATITSSGGIYRQFSTNGEEYEYSIVLDEGENSLTLKAQHKTYGEGGGTLNDEIHISVLCDAVLTVLDPEPVTYEESVLIEDCIDGSIPNPGGGGSGPL